MDAIETVKPLAMIGDVPQTGTTGDTATNAFGLGFEQLLQIILTQLTYQDPLKPIDNFEFVSQLAQFSQIQQAENMNSNLSAILQAQTTSQAANLLGKTVDIRAGPTTQSGEVTSVSFQSGEPLFTIETDDGRTLANLSLASVTQIRED